MTSPLPHHHLLNMPSQSSYHSSPHLRYGATLNRKKLAKRYRKDNNTYRQYPLLNLWILITMILSVSQVFFKVDNCKFIHLIPIPLMAFYISNKSSGREHLLPKIIKLGLIISFVGNLSLFFDKGRAEKVIAAGCYSGAFLIYAVGLNIGKKVRYVDFCWKYLMRLGGVAILFFQLWWQYKTLENSSKESILWEAQQNQFFVEQTKTENESYILFIVLHFQAFIATVVLIIALLRYQIASPCSYSFSLFGSACLFISANLWRYNALQNHSMQFIFQVIISICYNLGQYILMHGALHHSNMLYQIGNFIRNKQKQGSSGVGSSIKQENDYIYRNGDLHFQIGSSCRDEKETNSSDEEQYVSKAHKIHGNKQSIGNSKKSSRKRK